MILNIVKGLPLSVRSPISISARPQLTSCRGNLLSGQPGRGTPVYAGSFIKDRRIIFEEELLLDIPLLRLILIHELCHFVWPVLGNVIRLEYSALLEAERDARARGELGESSTFRKATINISPANWKDYVCESFCDTAAWMYSGVQDHESFALGRRWRSLRAAWFQGRLERYWKLRCP